MAKHRGTYLLLSDLDLLTVWAGELRAMVPDGLIGVYLVGSSLRTRKYRDVDVRIVVDDEVYESVFKRFDLARFHTALSIVGQRFTGLPIDCQVQSLSTSSEEASKPDVKTPHPLHRRPSVRAEELDRIGALP